MPSSRIKALLFPAGGRRWLNICYVIVYLFVVITAVFKTLVLVMASASWDTHTYWDAADVLLSGHLDMTRTPVYPLFLALCRWLFGQHLSYVGAEAIQWVIFFCSLPALRLLSERVIGAKHDVAVFIVVALYAFNPWIYQYNDWILTESLSISGSVFFFASLARGVTESRGVSMFKATIWLLTLILLRPIFICYLPVIVVALIIWWFQSGRGARRAVFGGLGGMAGIALVCGLYVYGMHRCYGIHSLTIINSVNNYYVYRDGLITPESSASPKVREVLARNLGQKTSYEITDIDEVWMEEMTILDELGPAEFEAFIKELQKNNPGVKRDVIADRLLNRSRDYCLIPTNFLLSGIGIPAKGLDFTMFHALLLLIAEAVGFVGLWLWRRRADVLIIVIGGCTLTLIVSCFVGAQDEYNRLFTPALPLFCLLQVDIATRLLTRLKTWKQSRSE